MGFASSYLEHRTLFPELVKEAPDRKTGIIIVIPAYSEPGITRVLDSLAACSQPGCTVEVLIVVNAPENAKPECIENNKIALLNIESWKKANSSFFRLFAISAGPLKGWGVGMARKTGMDEALRRFDSIDCPDGIILSLDADCLIDENYLVSVFSGFKGSKSNAACSVYFEHPLAGTEFSPELYAGITLYELHLRYYYQGLAFAGYPYVFHTVGSSMAVKSITYARAGGMNRRQAGEDFYLIQKLVSMGGYFYNTGTTVRPSPRPSFRVPFGTGATIVKLKESKEISLLTYVPDAFRELKSFFGQLECFFGCSPGELHEIYGRLPEGIRDFITADLFTSRVEEIRNNTCGFASFGKRFFSWFNMFMIVRFLNESHRYRYSRRPVQSCAAVLLNELSSVNVNPDDPLNLLKIYRELEKPAPA